MTQTLELITSEITTFEPDRIGEIIEAIRKDALSVTADVTTRQGRETLKSVAYKVSQSKTTLSKLAKESIDDHKRIVESVTKERRRMEAELDAIRDEVKAPALEWEANEEKRKSIRQNRINAIRQSVADLDQLCMADLESRRMAIESAIDFDWMEYQPLAQSAHDDAMGRIDAAISIEKDRLAKEAELLDLRKLQEKAELEEQRRKSAMAAVFDIRTTHSKFEDVQPIDRLALIQSIADLECMKPSEEFFGDLLEMAESSRQTTIALLKYKLANLDELMLTAKAEDEAKAKAELEMRQEDLRQRAIEDERQRVTAEEKRNAEEAEKRAANQKHVNEVLDTASRFVSKHGGVTLIQAKDIVKAIQEGKIPNVTLYL